MCAVCPAHAGGCLLPRGSPRPAALCTAQSASPAAAQAEQRACQQQTRRCHVPRSSPEAMGVYMLYLHDPKSRCPRPGGLAASWLEHNLHAAHLVAARALLRLRGLHISKLYWIHTTPKSCSRGASQINSQSTELDQAGWEPARARLRIMHGVFCCSSFLLGIMYLLVAWLLQLAAGVTPRRPADLPPSWWPRAPASSWALATVHPWLGGCKHGAWSSPCCNCAYERLAQRCLCLRSGLTARAARADCIARPPHASRRYRGRCAAHSGRMASTRGHARAGDDLPAGGLRSGRACTSPEAMRAGTAMRARAGAVTGFGVCILRCRPPFRYRPPPIPLL